MKKIILAVILLTSINVSPVQAVYNGQFCKESQLGNVQQKLKSRTPKPKYDIFQCQLSGKRYKWVKVN